MSLSTENMLVSLRSKFSRRKMRVISSFDELHVYADLIVTFLHAPFKDVRDAEFFRDLTQVFRRGFVMLRGGTRNDFQVRYFNNCRFYRPDSVSKRGVLLLLLTFDWHNPAIDFSGIVTGAVGQGVSTTVDFGRNNWKISKLAAIAAVPAMKTANLRLLHRGSPPVRRNVSRSFHPFWLFLKSPGNHKEAIGKPRTMITTMKRTAAFEMSKNEKTCVAI